MKQISSTQNERAKRVARLQRKAAARRAEQCTVIEGQREVSRAVSGGWHPSELWLCPALGGDEVPLLSHGMPCDTVLCTPEVFRKISCREGPDGVLAVGPFVGIRMEELSLQGSPLILVAEGIEKPGNLGALLRTADGAGVDAILVCDPATDLNNPSVIRNSIASLFSRAVVEATTADAVEFLRTKGIRVVAALPDAERIYSDLDLTGPLALVVGAEDTGLSPAWKKAADECVRIPMRGVNDSLNVSVSAAVLLYEALRQRS